LGFGNILAEQVMRVHKVFEHLQESVPPDFLHPISRESMVDLLAALSRAFCEEETLVRVSGSLGMGYIVAMAAILFPMDTTLIIGSFVVLESTKILISLEIELTSNSDCPTQIRIEKLLKNETPDSLPIKIVSHEATSTRSSRSFEWTGHVADLLCLQLADFGVSCTSALLIACCDILLLLPKLVGISKGKDFYSLLGPEPMQRIYHVCRLVFRQTPSGKFEDIISAYENLKQTFTNCARVEYNCTCGVCDLDTGWKIGRVEWRSKNGTCIARKLWRSVAIALDEGFWSLFVNAEVNAVIEYRGSSRDLSLTTRAIHHALFRIVEHPIRGSYIHKSLMRLVGPLTYTIHTDLAWSNRSSTMCPASLLRLKRGLDEGVQYELRDGQILVDGRYYTRLRFVSAKARPMSSKSLYQGRGKLTPTSLGEHSNLIFTVQESLHCLELRTTAMFNGQSLHLNLAEIIISSLVAQFAAPCEHDHDSALDEAYCIDVITTSVVSPLAEAGKVAITQTRGNPVAQLLACGAKNVSLLQRDCCLNCAVKQAMEEKFSQIIVM
jgi:hypothetical protein